MFTLWEHDLPLYWQDSEIDSDIIIDHPEKYEYKKIQTIFFHQPHWKPLSWQKRNFNTKSIDVVIYFILVFLNILKQWFFCG